MFSARASIPSASLHPHLQLKIDTPPGPEQCDLRLSLSLPDSLFIDPFELPGAISSSSKIAGWSITPDVIDIERPVASQRKGKWKAVEAEGEQTLSLELTHAFDSLNLDLPLHARYLAPSEAGEETVTLFGADGQGCLQVSWSCPGSEHAPAPCLAIPAVNLQLPTGIASHLPYVEFGTAAAMWLGFGWISYKVWQLRRRVRLKDQKAS